MKIQVDSSTGCFAIKCEVQIKGSEVLDLIPTEELENNKLLEVIQEGILSAGLWRGAFAKARRLMAGIKVDDKKTKIPAGWKLADVKYSAEMAEKIGELVKGKLGEFGEVSGLVVSEYVVEKKETAKTAMEIIAELVKAGKLGADTDVAALAATVKAGIAEKKANTMETMEVAGEVEEEVAA